MADTPNVAYCRADFARARARWELVRTFLDGEDAVKAKGEALLPRPSGMTRTVQGEAHYRAYLERAEVPSLVAPTVRGLVGTLHRKPAAVTLPPRIDFLRERTSQDGLGLEAFARRLSWDLVAYGRAPILVDFAGMAPRLIAYRPWELINWREQIIDGESRLTLAVLELSRDAGEQDDIFSHETVTEWLVLRLAGGIYSIDRWRQGSTDAGPVMREASITPAIRGAPLTEIPLIIPGANDVTPDIDEIPMLGLTRLALSLYRNSADVEQGLFLAGNPTPYMTGLAPEIDPQSGQPAPIRLGPGSGYYLPDPQGQFRFAEVQGAGFAAQRENMAQKFQRAVQLGAAMLESSKRAAESGEALRLRQAAQSATLESIAQAEGEAIRRALRIAARWADADERAVEYRENTDFVPAVMTAQERQALVAGWLSGAYGRQALFQALHEGEALPADWDYEDYLADAEGETAGGGQTA